MLGQPLTASERRVVDAARHLVSARADEANVVAVVRTADGNTFAAVNVGSAPP